MDIGIQSAKGHVRSMNQDLAQFFVNKANIKMAILCDGMGGQNAGDVASEMAVRQLGHAFEESNNETVPSLSVWLKEHIEKENQRIYEKSLQFDDLEGMGTTLVLAVFIEDIALIANVGDSRAYHYRNGQLQQITSDHSFVNELVKTGEISREEAEHHPKRNILVSALGSKLSVKLDLFEVKLKINDHILLTSDGMHHYFNDNNVYSILDTKSNAQEKAEAFIKLGLSGPANDNLTICVCHKDRRES